MKKYKDTPKGSDNVLNLKPLCEYLYVKAVWHKVTTSFHRCSVMCNALQYKFVFGFLSLFVCFTFPILFVLPPQDTVEPPHQQNSPTNTATMIKDGSFDFSIWQ